ncbi:MAG: nicotinate-nucleotide adenylyltransferase [Peptococcaceae bacterium]|nr:nicotinate-nucleotide adenylyltransferase [Peptococcaceae bacterium]
MNNETRKEYHLGVMGGTFDPIHYGHLVAAEGARHSLSLERVIFIPAGSPPHKPGYFISEPRDRYTMTCLAVASNSFFEASTLEVDRPGPSYTIDTIHALKQLYPEHQIYFITGADALLEILTWKAFEELLTICRFVAATRPGYRLSELQSKLNQLPGNLKQNILCMEVPALAISSTDIRQRVREGRPIKYLLPESVEEYVLKKHLYRT